MGEPADMMMRWMPTNAKETNKMMDSTADFLGINKRIETVENNAKQLEENLSNIANDVKKEPVAREKALHELNKKIERKIESEKSQLKKEITHNQKVEINDKLAGLRDMQNKLSNLATQEADLQEKEAQLQVSIQESKTEMSDLQTEIGQQKAAFQHTLSALQNQMREADTNGKKQADEAKVLAGTAKGQADAAKAQADAAKGQADAAKELADAEPAARDKALAELESKLKVKIGSLRGQLKTDITKEQTDALNRELAGLHALKEQVDGLANQEALLDRKEEALKTSMLKNTAELRTEIGQKTADFQQSLSALQTKLSAVEGGKKEADAAKKEADAAKKEADAAKKEADVAKKKADVAKKKANEARKDADEAKKEAGTAKKKADAAKNQADAEPAARNKAIKELRNSIDRQIETVGSHLKTDITKKQESLLQQKLDELKKQMVKLEAHEAAIDKTELALEKSVQSNKERLESVISIQKDSFLKQLDELKTQAADAQSMGAALKRVQDQVNVEPAARDKAIAKLDKQITSRINATNDKLKKAITKEQKDLIASKLGELHALRAEMKRLAKTEQRIDDAESELKTLASTQTDLDRQKATFLKTLTNLQNRADEADMLKDTLAVVKKKAEAEPAERDRKLAELKSQLNATIAQTRDQLQENITAKQKLLLDDKLEKLTALQNEMQALALHEEEIDKNEALLKQSIDDNKTNLEANIKQQRVHFLGQLEQLRRKVKETHALKTSIDAIQTQVDAEPAARDKAISILSNNIEAKITHTNNQLKEAILTKKQQTELTGKLEELNRIKLDIAELAANEKRIEDKEALIAKSIAATNAGLDEQKADYEQLRAKMDDTNSKEAVLKASIEDNKKEFRSQMDTLRKRVSETDGPKGTLKTMKKTLDAEPAERDRKLKELKSQLEATIQNTSDQLKTDITNEQEKVLSEKLSNLHSLREDIRRLENHESEIDKKEEELQKQIQESDARHVADISLHKADVISRLATIEQNLQARARAELDALQEKVNLNGASDALAVKRLKQEFKQEIKKELAALRSDIKQQNAEYENTLLYMLQQQATPKNTLKVAASTTALYATYKGLKQLKQKFRRRQQQREAAKAKKAAEEAAAAAKAKKAAEEAAAAAKAKKAADEATKKAEYEAAEAARSKKAVVEAASEAKKAKREHSSMNNKQPNRNRKRQVANTDSTTVGATVRATVRATTRPTTPSRPRVKKTTLPSTKHQTPPKRRTASPQKTKKSKS